MKFLVKLLLKAGVALGVLFVAYRFFLPGMGGFQLPGMGDKAATGIKDLGNAVVEKDVTVYQWTDEQGVTHFGGTPPTGQGSYEKKEIRANTNVMQAMKQAEEEEAPEERSRIARIGKAYTPEGVKDLMQDAKDVQKQMEDRAAEQQKILDEL